MRSPDTARKRAAAAHRVWGLGARQPATELLTLCDYRHEGRPFFQDSSRPKHTAIPPPSAADPPAFLPSEEGACLPSLHQYFSRRLPSMPDPVSKQSGREALRGAEVLAFDLIFEVLTSQQLAELLTAPLERAAAKGNRDLAQRLVGAGAGIGEALHEAIRGRHGEIVSDLVESGASIAAKDAEGNTPLHVAAYMGETEMAQLLMLKGADKDAFDYHEWTPLCHAAYCGNPAITLALLAAGADVSVRYGHLKTPVIHAAAAQLGKVEILRAMIEHGEDVDAVDILQHTALHVAGAFNEMDPIDVLLKAGANIEAQNRYGRTPLHHASYELSQEALVCLLEHGATVNAQDEDLQTPLMRSVLKAGTQGAAEMVDSLLRAGADETIVDDKGSKAADMIGFSIGEEDRLAEDVERVRELLANAPADRAWRRRGYLVLCRAHPDRVQQGQVIDGNHYNNNVARRTRSRAKMARAGGIVGDSTADESTTGGDWAVVVSKVLLLQEEGIFRTIVGYL